jgi:hypothetical protein
VQCGHADVAQLVEQLIRNQQVIGSSPIVGSITIRRLFFLENIETLCIFPDLIRATTLKDLLFRFSPLHQKQKYSSVAFRYSRTGFGTAYPLVLPPQLLR